MWKTLPIILILGLIVTGAQVTAGEWNEREMKQYYEAQVAWEIDHCLEKCHLMDSRSPALRAKAREEIGKAHYLRANQAKLVREMMDADIGLRHYKVQQYINHRYHNHGRGYAALNLNYCE